MAKTLSRHRASGLLMYFCVCKDRCLRMYLAKYTSFSSYSATAFALHQIDWSTRAVLWPYQMQVREPFIHFSLPWFLPAQYLCHLLLWCNNSNEAELNSRQEDFLTVEFFLQMFKISSLFIPLKDKLIVCLTLLVCLNYKAFKAINR